MFFIAYIYYIQKQVQQSVCGALKFICLLLLCSSLFPFAAVASTATLTVTVVYTIETHQIATTASFSDSISNPNDTNVRLDFAFPADVLSSGVPVIMTVYSTAESAVVAEAPLPSGKLGANTFYNFSFTNANTGSIITSFDKPITLTFFYSDADISGIDESTLVPYRWNGSSWSALTSYTVDTVVNKVTVSTQQFSTFSLLGTAPAQQQSSSNGSSGGGGGGGGGGIIAPVTSVVFSGRAYPKNVVTLLKDAQIAATAVAGGDAGFSMKLSGLSGGNYIFAVYSEDSKGIRSSLLTFPVSVTSGATSFVSGIFIAPTIAVDKSEVKRGDNIAIFGQSVPNGEITVAISSEEEFFGKTSADQNGAYLYNFDTTQLDMGQHFTKSKVAKEGAISSFSKAISFLVGTKNIAAELPKVVTKGDMNNDRRVNLVDFSIAAYWYKRSSPPASVDLNGDGKVDLIDFSIMAFYWTG